MMKKKIITILTLAAVFFWFAPQEVAQAETVGDGSTEHMLYYTDATTGETSLIHMETSNESAGAERVSAGSREMLPRAIIGKDDREEVADVTVAPYSAIASLQVWYTDGTQINTTGFMVSPRTMLTAAHCIVEGDRTVSRIEVFLKYNGTAKTPTGVHPPGIFVLTMMIARKMILKTIMRLSGFLLIFLPRGSDFMYRQIQVIY